MRRITRSGQELLARCKRKYYWSLLYKKGLDSPTPDPNFALGLSLHSGMEELLLTGDVDAAVFAALLNTSSLDQNAKWLSEALVRGWHRTRYTEFLERYELISTEKETPVPLAANVILDSRADAVVRRKADSTYWVLNWKTSASLYDWSSKWETDIQTWTEAWSIQNHLGLPVAGVLYEGMYKGWKNKGQYQSILIKGWRKELQTVDGQAYYAYATEKKAGYEAFWAATDFPGGIEAWIAFLPEDIVAKNFITSFPILKADEVVDQWIQGTVREETDIEAMLEEQVPEEDRLVYFRQRFGMHCKWCPFRPACLLQTTVDDMAESGELVPRRDHHAVEEVE